MNKTELIAAVAEQSGLSKKDAEKAVSSTIDTIINTVAEGEKIQIAGFGTFEQRQRNARTGCDPRTGKSIEIPASKVPAFKAGKGFKDVRSRGKAFYEGHHPFSNASASFTSSTGKRA